MRNQLTASPTTYLAHPARHYNAHMRRVRALETMIVGGVK